MKQTGIYNCWYYFRKGEVGGQMATLITLVMAVIFLFVAVTLNIGRVAQKKTLTANAADGAAMKIASYLGSYANKLSLEVLDGDRKECKRHWGGAFKIIAIVIAAVTQQWWAVALLAASYAYDMASMDTGSLNQIMRQMSKLTLENQIAEQGVLYAFANCVDDPTMVVDLHDYNEDGDTTDEISQFTKWYMEERALKWTMPESARRAKIADFMAKVGDFAREADEFRQTFTEDETRALALECLDPPDCTLWGVVATPDNDGEFITLLEELKAVFEEAAAGFPITFWIENADIFDPADLDYNLDEVDGLSFDLYDFYLFALDEDEAGLCLLDLDTLVQIYDVWMPMFYTEEPWVPDPDDPDDEPGQTWHEAWEEHLGKMNSWHPELHDVGNQLNAIIAAEPDPVQQAYLQDLQDRVYDAIGRIADFQDTLTRFNNEIYMFYLNTKDDVVGDDYEYEPKDTYSWHDSAGWHHVRVEVPTKIELPYIRVKTHRRWYGKKVCVSVERASGDVKVLVDRYDQSSDHFFLARGRHPWWRFRYVQDGGAEDAAEFNPADPEQALELGVHTESIGHYTYNALPTIKSVR